MLLQTFASLALILAIVAPAHAQRSSSAPMLVLAGIHIRPFSQLGNELLPSLAEERAPFNELDLSYLVTVSVKGPAGKYPRGRRVEIVVTAGARVVAKHVTNIGVLSNTGEYFAPCWIYGPVCEPLTIKARLIGDARRSSVTTRINAHCGE